MPRFFFDTRSDLASFRDFEGVELASVEKAIKEALKALPEILRDELPTETERCDIKVDVRDDVGRIIFTAHLSLIAKWINSPFASDASEK